LPDAYALPALPAVAFTLVTDAHDADAEIFSPSHATTPPIFSPQTADAGFLSRRDKIPADDSQADAAERH